MDYHGKYLIGEKLGRGAMSEIYKARAPVTNRVVALKILSPRDDIFIDLVGEEKLREIFLEEARIMGEIRHNHIAEIIECDGEGSTPHIALEYSPHCLGSMVNDSTRVEVSRIISVEATYSYLSQILLGLERLHTIGIVHRDIKPHNLLIDPENTVKIIDFGLCMVAGVEKMRIPGMQIGSPFYTAPEQEQNPGKVDERADLFGVGIIAYRLLTGRLANHRELIPPASRFNSQLSPAWDEFIAIATNPAPQNRYQSACRMREDLEDIYHSWREEQSEREDLQIQAEKLPRHREVGKKLRSVAGAYSSEDLRRLVGLDSWMKPKHITINVFETAGRKMIRSPKTARVWQREGAVQPMNWEEAHRYIKYLNANKWQGHDSWRLPTVEELMTLLSSCPAKTRLHESIKWLWSADAGGTGSAWVIDVQEAFFLEMDKNDMAFVCGVSTITE